MKTFNTNPNLIYSVVCLQCFSKILPNRESLSIRHWSSYTDLFISRWCLWTAR